MTATFRITHHTAYRYDRPVSLGPHRLMIRPRDGHDLRVLDSAISITPDARLRWGFDTFGNSIGRATFSDPSDTLEIISKLLIRRYPLDTVLRSEDQGHTPYPFEYDEHDRIDLQPLLPMENPHEHQILQDWLASRFVDRPDDALAFLQSLSDTIHASLEYSRRDEVGTQTAAETIEKGRGTCRDFALIFMEAARSLGFAARFVTGYLYDPTGDGNGVVGSGATHAWAEIFLPHTGWVEFDPTNRIVAGVSLIRVAVTRTAAQASPITGTFAGDDAVLLDLDVTVDVTEEADAGNAA